LQHQHEDCIGYVVCEFGNKPVGYIQTLAFPYLALRWARCGCDPLLQKTAGAATSNLQILSRFFGAQR
jgi:hypothetical protein